MIEAMACGTPVIAFNFGSVPEVVENGRTGYVVDSVAEAAAAVHRLQQIDRRDVRASFERRFTVEIMARKYEDAYRRLLGAVADEAVQVPEHAGSALAPVRPGQLPIASPLGAEPRI
jgi:hypothetical protein